MMKNKYAILQLTDLYLTCEQSKQIENEETFNLIAYFINKYHPDLCIFTGNQIWAEDQETGAALYQRFLEFMNQFEVKIATTFGDKETCQELTRTQLRQLEAKYSTNYAHKYCSSIANDKEAYIIESPYQQIFALDNGVDGKIEDEHLVWLQEKLKHRGKHVAHRVLFMHRPIKAYDNVFVYIGEKKDKISYAAESERVFSVLQGASNIDGIFCGHDYDNDFTFFHQGIGLNYGRVSGVSLYSDLAPGARLIHLFPERSYTTCILDSDIEAEEDAEEDLSVAELMEKIVGN